MLRDCHKVLGCSYYFSRVSQEIGSWSSSLGILGNDPRRREHLITMHPMSQKYLARKKCNRHCTKSQASSGHIRSSSDKLQVLPSQLGWSVNSLSSWDCPQFCLNFCHHARVMPQVFTNRTKTKRNKNTKLNPRKITLSRIEFQANRAAKTVTHHSTEYID